MVANTISPSTIISPDKLEKSPIAQSRFQPTMTYRDVWASILFLLHLAFYLGFSLPSLYAFVRRSSFASHCQESLMIGRVVCAVMLGTSVCSLLFVILAWKFPRQMIHSAFLMTIGGTLIATIHWMITMSDPRVIIGGGTTFIASSLLYFTQRKKIEFSALLLKNVVAIPDDFPACILSSLAISIFAAFYFSYFAIATLGLPLVFTSSKYQILFEIYSVFSMYWTTSFLSLLNHTIASGVFASLFFCKGTGKVVSNPTLKSARRALTYSFGSIAIAALVSSFIRIVFAPFAMMDEESSVFAAMGDCLCGWLRYFLSLANQYTVVQVAIYGKSYPEAARDTYSKMHRSGLAVLINDQLITHTLSMLAVINLVVTGVLVYLMTDGIEVGKQLQLGIGIAAIAMTLLVTAISTSIIEAGTATILACIGEEPQQLRLFNPSLAESLCKHYPNMMLSGIPEIAL